jgi:hypothetical protein
VRFLGKKYKKMGRKAKETIDKAKVNHFTISLEAQKIIDNLKSGGKSKFVSEAIILKANNLNTN